ncbi:MAG: 2-C-methyl-D-erythritol 2,4-cyclodiphosphate synthase [Candidatus Dadabacteria bacterium]|nr:MAG: 2-C-methyl-D-erythritol 2,4-cyclodiphosphate synthase [Candidatus Dadabacteria bacterium]
MEFRVGLGFDIHPFSERRKLILGGVEIPESRGLKGHSDADVLLHAVIDALLGASGQGDIGEHFPDTKEEFKDINSTELVSKIYNLITEKGWSIVNIDCVVIAEKPKISPYKEKIKKAISSLLKIPKENVNVKAATSEKLGALGREEGIAAQCVVLLKKD